MSVGFGLTSLASKMRMMLLLMGLLIGTIALTTLYFQQGANKIDGIRIDLAGRNRMLSQKAALKVTLVNNGIDRQNNLKQLHSIIQLHEDSYTLLRKGGEHNGFSIRQGYSDFKGEFDQIEKSWSNYSQTINQLLNSGSLDFQRLSALSEEMLVNNNKLVQAMVQDYNSRNLLYNRVYSAISAIGFIVLAISFFIIKNSLISPTQKILFHIKEQASGKLDGTLNLTSTDEIGQIASQLDNFASKIAKLIADLETTSSQLFKSTEFIDSFVIEVNESVTETASSIEEISASLEELEGTSELNANLSQSTAASSANSLSSIQNIQEKSQELLKSLTSIERRIADIVEISSQTNFLALNAAVEATKAGEHGKGFSVIARDIRQLADNTVNTTGFIQNLIEQCGSLAQSTNELIFEQEQTVNQLYETLSSINSSSQEQSKGIKEINLSVETVNRASQHNSQRLNELNATASSINELAKAMRQTISTIGN